MRRKNQKRSVKNSQFFTPSSSCHFDVITRTDFDINGVLFTSNVVIYFVEDNPITKGYSDRMFEGAVAGVLNRLLGKYVEDLDTESLNVGIFSGTVHLTSLKLKPEALYELDLPIDVKIGTIGHINIQIPWTSLSNQPVIVNIEDVLILVGPAISNTHFNPEREKRLTRAAKRKILQDLEAESEVLSAPKNVFESLFTAVLNNIQIYVRNVHIRYEDSISSKDGPMACGLCLQSLSIETTNSKWKPSLTPQNATTIYQMMRLESLSLYWNPTATVLADSETANITPMQYYNWKHYMITGLDKFNMHQEDFEFLLKPVSCKVKVMIHRSEEPRVPRLLADAVLQDSALTVSRRQLLSASRLWRHFATISLNRKYRHIRPSVRVQGAANLWWQYAFKAVLEQRVRPYSWQTIAKHRQNYVQYKQIYKSVLRSPNDTELKLDLQQCEDNLPIISVVIAREQAKFELLAVEPDRVQLVLEEEMWWRPNSSPELSEPEETSRRVKLCTHARSNKSLWSHLSLNEKDRLRELIGFVEGGPKDKPKQYIEHKINLTLAHSSVTLTNRNSELFALTLSQLLVSLETRPCAKAYKLSVRIESLMLEGIGSDGSLAPLISPERSQCTASTHLLAVDWERLSHQTTQHYALTCVVQPLMVHYNEHALTELMNFSYVSNFSTESLTNDLHKVVNKTHRVAERFITQAVNRRSLFDLNIDLKGVCAVIPEKETDSKSSQIMIVDIYRTVLKTELQPTDLVLEDATCMELEERLYDRLHAETTFQVLFCDKDAPWRETRKQPDSDLHLIAKMKTQVVFSNSVRKEYKLLPRYKLNVSLSSLKLNLSDRTIFQLLDFIENLPAPSPNTLASDSQDLALMICTFPEDLMPADLKYSELLQMQQNIVDGCFQRKRSTEKSFTKENAKSSFSSRDAASLSDKSEEETELFARNVDLPGFEDNVSPHNHIHTLLRFVIGEAVISLARSTRESQSPYIVCRIRASCLDCALLNYGPAAQLTIQSASVLDHQHKSADGQFLEVFSCESKQADGLLNLLYRKVRADCPDFRSHVHSVEQSLVVDTGDVTLMIHSDALRTLYKFLQYIYDKIQARHSVQLQKAVVTKVKSVWDRVMRSENDPPVPSGATKFSYSVRILSISSRLCHTECSALQVHIAGVESELIYRANDKMMWKLFVLTLKVDDYGGNHTLYPALVWPDEDKVLEVKYVRAAPKHYGEGEHVKANGELKVYVGKVHVVLFCTILQQLQQFLEPLIARSSTRDMYSKSRHYIEQRFDDLNVSNLRLHLAIVIQAPVFLLPQKQSSPNLLVLDMGELGIENFFKQQRVTQDLSSPIQNPIIDNILVKWSNATLSRAVMTLAGSLEVQEPILEPISFRCDMKRTVKHSQVRTVHKDLLKYEISSHLECVSINLGQRDLATIFAVWRGNVGEGFYFGEMFATHYEISTDSNVKNLQNFLAQGEPVRKDVVFRFSLEGVELKFYTDVDEVLSSPVRDSARALCCLTAGEFTTKLERFTDGAYEINLSLQSLAIDDIRVDSPCSIKRIFECSGHEQSNSCVKVSGAALAECCVYLSADGSGDRLSLNCDRLRVNVAPALLMPVCQALQYSVPGETSPPPGITSGVVNHGFVGDPPRSRPGSLTESTCGYYVNASPNEEKKPLTISIQFRQPEIMFYTDISKTESHALLLRTELLIDYSSHSNTQSLCISLAGLQIMSKLQSKFKSFPTEIVLRPCDIEYSKVFNSIEEGIKVCLSCSEIDFHLAPTTIHTVIDIIEDIKTELIQDEKELFHLTLPKEKLEDDLWAPRKVSPTISCAHDEGFPRVGDGVAESFCLMVPSVKIMLEIEEGGRYPILQAKMQLECELQDWSRQLHGSGTLAVLAEIYNGSLRVWEPLLEPVTKDGNVYSMWTLKVNVFQAKSFPISTKFDTKTHYQDLPQTPQKPRRKSGFESETSEGDTDNETVFIKHPNCHEDKGYFPDYASVTGLDGDESDSDNENRLMDKLTSAIRHLFTDDSSADDNNQSDSSAEEQSEMEVINEKYNDKAVSFVDIPSSAANDNKNVVIEEQTRSSSVDSGLETDSLYERSSTYIVLHCETPLNFTVTSHGLAGLAKLRAALARPRDMASYIVQECGPLQLSNDIGPGSKVELISRREKDLKGNDAIIATAQFIVDNSRPSTPGCDVSSDDLLETTNTDVPRLHEDEDLWNCFEGGFTEKAVSPVELGESCPEPLTAAKLYENITAERLRINIDGFDELAVLCPQRSATKLHVLHPSKDNQRYFVLVETEYKCNTRRIVVRSPMQIRNETSYALEVFYKCSEAVISSAPIGSIRNPFDDKLRLCTLAPSDTCVVPLNIAYNCVLYVMPTGTEKNYTLSSGIWWGELSRDTSLVRDVTCPAKGDDGGEEFALRLVVEEGPKSPKLTRSIPNYLIRLIPPVCFHNRLPCQATITLSSHTLTLEPGAKITLYTVLRNERVNVELKFLGHSWSQGFTYNDEISEKLVSLKSDSESESVDYVLRVCVRVTRREERQVYLYAPYWVLNKTGLPLHMKGTKSDAIYNLTSDPLPFGFRGLTRLRVRAHGSRWSRAFLPQCVPGLIVCVHKERGCVYRILMNTTHSEQSPELTKIITLLPYFIVHNDTKRHLRFMEENECADLWIDLAPLQSVPFWPQTNSMAMHCKYRESTYVSQHFAVTKNHFTVLRMDKGSAISVEVKGGTDTPFTVTFKPYSVGDAPVRVDNLCDDLFLKLHQIDSGQVALLSPCQSMFYTWDDPMKDRVLLWNIYNNKGQGYIADFSQDGYGEQKVCFHSVKHSTLTATNSVTSKLSSTFKRLTPKSPETLSSSSEDSDSSSRPELKPKKARKDKAFVYWVSYTEGNQRVFALAQDERIAYQYRQRILTERSNYEVYLSLAKIGLSLCCQKEEESNELSFVSVSDSLPKWEVNVAHKWKSLTPDLTSWIEDKFQKENKKCNLKDYLHIDLEKMQMTKPFFSELRRTYNPGLWVQYRKSDNYTYIRAKIHRFQIDDQSNEACFPCVLYLAPSLLNSETSKPAFEILCLKQNKPSINQTVYKHVKILTQEHYINLDRGFVFNMLDFFNMWETEDLANIKFRKDLSLVHMPLSSIVLLNQGVVQKNVYFEFVHISSIKFVLSLSSRGYINDGSNKSGFGTDGGGAVSGDFWRYLLDYWGASVSEIKDVCFKLQYMEIQNSYLTQPALIQAASNHYKLQMLQQFYVLALNSRVLGNAFSGIGDFSKAVHYYEPSLGILCNNLQDIEFKLGYGVAALLGHYTSGMPRAGSVFHDTSLHIDKGKKHKFGVTEWKLFDYPRAVIELSRSYINALAYTHSNLLDRRNFDDDSAIESHVYKLYGRNGDGDALRARLPRPIAHYAGVSPYNWASSAGAGLAHTTRRHDGHRATVPCAPSLLIQLTARQLTLLRSGCAGATNQVLWSVGLDDLNGVPVVKDIKLVLSFKQDELTNYYSTDEKIIEVSDPETLTWIQEQIECALILTMEDKRCPAQF